MEIVGLNELINKFKEPYILNKYARKNKIIVKNFMQELEKRREILKKILKEENKIWNTNFKLERIFEIIFEEYNSLEENNKKFGIGNVVAITNGDVYLQIDLIIKSIISNCRILIISSPTLLKFNLYIVSIIQSILKEESLDEHLISVVNCLYYKQKIAENQKHIDCIIINKEYEEYDYFRRKIDSKVIYLDYGNINVYVDSDEFENEVKEIIKEANCYNMDVYKYNISNLEQFLNNEINNFVFNTAVVFSKDIKKCMKFFEILKANNIFINEFNFNKIQIGLKVDELQFEKKLVIKK